MSILPFVQQETNRLLKRIASMWKAPKITLVIRNPDLDDGDFIMSDDNLDDVIAAINHLKERQSA